MVITTRSYDIAKAAARRIMMLEPLPSCEVWMLFCSVALRQKLGRPCLKHNIKLGRRDRAAAPGAYGTQRGGGEERHRRSSSLRDRPRLASAPPHPRAPGSAQDPAFATYACASRSLRVTLRACEVFSESIAASVPVEFEE